MKLHAAAYFRLVSFPDPLSSCSVEGGSGDETNFRPT